jgi:hypothetical protein
MPCQIKRVAANERSENISVFSSSIANLHMLSLGPRANCKGSRNGVNKLATQLVCLGKSNQRVIEL